LKVPNALFFVFINLFFNLIVFEIYTNPTIIDSHE
jgi:hypothetical protein